MLFKDVVNGRSVRVGIRSDAELVTPVYGVADEKHLTLLVRICPTVGFGSFLACVDETFGVVEVPRKGGEGAPRLLPQFQSGSYVSLARVGDSVAVLGFSIASAIDEMNSGASQPHTVAKIVVSKDGAPFDTLSTYSGGTSTEACMTADGRGWTIAESGLVASDPATGEWADVSTVSIKGPGSVACGRSTIAVADWSSGAIVDATSLQVVARLDLNANVLGRDQPVNLMGTLELDAVTMQPYTFVEGSMTRSVVSWTADGAIGSTRSVPPNFAGPMAGDVGWRSSSATDEAEVVDVGAE
jgi:ribosomal protein S27AE